MWRLFLDYIFVYTLWKIRRSRLIFGSLQVGHLLQCSAFPVNFSSLHLNAKGLVCLFVSLALSFLFGFEDNFSPLSLTSLLFFSAIRSIMHTEYATNVKLSDGCIRDLFFFPFPRKKETAELVLWKVLKPEILEA